ncbi:TPA: MutL protein [Candidatus Bipolaricaulota bacterium]|nr:MutL protein [Candidatus Bipolaricaulota bacterium]
MVLLIDFGSTYTKVAAVDLKGEELIGWAQAVSTVESDVRIGLGEALAQLKEQIGRARFEHKLACSSAKGGLRIVAIGLVPELTAEAAKRAALGAGAKVLGVYSHKLTPAELREIVELRPDMILLAGGTDGGDSRVILYNSSALAASKVEAPIVVAGNKEIAEEVKATLERGGKEVTVTENVMPSLGKLNVEPVREAIRQLFMERIVEAKGIKGVEAFVGRVLMPTPDAVLKASELLADGTDGEEGLGELMVVDVGGATTDVDSIAEGKPKGRGVIWRGLPEPYAKRTVEGDLGLRVSAPGLLEAVGKRKLLTHIAASGASLEEGELAAAVERLAGDVGFVPRAPEEVALDEGMAKAAVELAVSRHVGSLREFYLPDGYCFVQEGKDLTEVKHLIGTGGIFPHTERSREILSCALFDEDEPLSLRPRAPRMWVDEKYILWAMGLLAEIEPNVALRMMKRNLKEV